MKAMVLERQDKLENNPLHFKELPLPEPADSEIRLKIDICGVCRTDLHIVEGELPVANVDIVNQKERIFVIIQCSLVMMQMVDLLNMLL